MALLLHCKYTATRHKMPISIRMTQTRQGDAGAVLTSGQTYSVRDQLGNELVGAKYAVSLETTLPSDTLNPIVGTPAQQAAFGGMVSGASNPAGYAGTLNRPTVMAIGTSLVAYSSIRGAIGARGACPYYAHLQMSLGLLGNPWRWVDTSAIDGSYGGGAGRLDLGMFGWGGATSSQIAPWYSQLIAPQRPNFVFIQMTDNDVTGSVEATADIIQRHLDIVDAAIASGSVPILFAGAPRTGINTLALQTRYWAIQRGIEAGLTTRPLCIYIPLYELYTDSATTYGPQPGTTGVMLNYTDGVHFLRGGIAVAEFIADKIRAKVPSLVPMQIPTPGSPQILNINNLLQGSTAGSGGMSGFVMPGYNVYSSIANGTCTGSKVLRKGREVLQIDVTTSGAQTGTLDILTFNLPAITAGWSIGDVVSVVADIEFDPAVPIVGVKTPQVFLNIIGAVTTYPSPNGVMLGYVSGADTGAAIIRPDMRIQMQTPPAPIPAAGSDAVTGLRPYFYLKCVDNTQAITMRMWVHSFSLINHNR